MDDADIELDLALPDDEETQPETRTEGDAKRLHLMLAEQQPPPLHRDIIKTNTNLAAARLRNARRPLILRRSNFTARIPTYVQFNDSRRSWCNYAHLFDPTAEEDCLLCWIPTGARRSRNIALDEVCYLPRQGDTVYLELPEKALARTDSGAFVESPVVLVIYVERIRTNSNRSTGEIEYRVVH